MHAFSCLEKVDKFVLNMVYLIKIIQSPEDDLDKVNKSLAVFTYRLLFQLFSCPIYILGQEKIIVRFRLPNEPNRAPPYQIFFFCCMNTYCMRKKNWYPLCPQNTRNFKQIV